MDKIRNAVKKEVEEDKIHCFARLSSKKCNALKKKECKNCSFYKHKDEVQNYEKYL